MQMETYNALIEAGLVSAKSIEDARQKSQSNNKSLLVNLFEKCDTDTQKSITETLAEFYKLPLLHLDTIMPSSNLVRLCKLEDARRWCFLPITEQGSHVVIGMVDPMDLGIVDELQRIFRKPIKTAFIHAYEFENSLYRFFRDRGTLPIERKQLIDTIRLQRIMARNSGISSEEQSLAISTTKFIRHVISRALTYGASDLLIEPSNDDEMVISLIIEGGMYRLFRLSKSQQNHFLETLKRMVKLDTSNDVGNQRRKIALRFDGRLYKLLMHFHTSPAGECVAIRLIDPRFTGLSIEQLGLSSAAEKIIKTSLYDLGLILVTGPRGSGKSTAFSTFLRHLADGKRRIISLEDLVIEKIPNVKQLRASSEGLSKPNVLRSLLHHTPDVIAIDEVTDEETLDMALQLASSACCLVVLSIESDGIAEAISRLLRMGADRSQLAYTLRLAYSQKIIRKICPDCKSSTSPHPETARRLNIPSTFTFYTGKGCDACKQTGYHGTVTIEEHIRFTPGLSKLLETGASGAELYTQSRYDGMLTLYESALNKAIDATTSLEEALGVFSPPSDFSFKDQLHLGRLDHLHEAEIPQEKQNLDDSLSAMFKEAAKEQAEPLDLDHFAGFQNDMDSDKEEMEEHHHMSPPSSPLDDVELGYIAEEEKGKEHGSYHHSPSPLEDVKLGGIAEEPASSQQEEKLKVLLLDDSPVMLEYTRHILSSTGFFDVQIATTVDEAWDKLEHQYFHLIITDHEMPEQTGQEFIKRIRKEPTLNHTGTMLLTGNVKEASALTGGADGYVAKPTDPELLIARSKSIAEIYKRMSSKATPSNVEASDHPSKGDTRRVDLTAQDISQRYFLELDSRRLN